MKNHVNRKIHLVPGVCAFSEKSVEIVTKIIRDNIGDPIVLAIGGLVPMVRLAYSNPNLGWIAMYMVKLFREKFPQSHIHAYGVGGPKWYPLVRLLGANSADYAGFLQYTFKGKILLQDGRAGYISKKIKYKGKTISRNFEDVFLKSDLKMLHDCQCPICNTFPQKKLEKSYQPRLIHNLYQVISKSNLIDEKIQNNEIDDVKKIIKNRIIHPNKGDIPKQVLIKTLEFV